MPKERPFALSIAGFDPSAGAGVLADIKTFEQHKVQGMGVVTGLTFQNDSEFDGVTWVQIDEIRRQANVLFRKFKFGVIKIGMIQDLQSLNTVVTDCRLKTPGCRLIWDPILKASAGFEIHKNVGQENLLPILKSIYLITPNTDEVRILAGEKDEMKAAKELSQYCNVFLKGGHSEKNKGKDFLFTKDGKIFPYRANLPAGRQERFRNLTKHGSGCVLSSAITANLALGNNLQRACLKGKDYVTKILASNKTLLGYHKI